MFVNVMLVVVVVMLVVVLVIVDGKFVIHCRHC